jgi:hypothetical protein
MVANFQKEVPGGSFSREVVLDLIGKTRECDRFVPWQEGRSLKDHEAMILLEEQRRWQTDQRREERQWQEGVNEHNRRWQRQSQRWSTILAGCFGLAGVLLGWLLTKFFISPTAPPAPIVNIAPPAVHVHVDQPTITGKQPSATQTEPAKK